MLVCRLKNLSNVLYYYSQSSLVLFYHYFIVLDSQFPLVRKLLPDYYHCITTDYTLFSVHSGKEDFTS